MNWDLDSVVSYVLLLLVLGGLSFVALADLTNWSLGVILLRLVLAWVVGSVLCAVVELIRERTRPCVHGVPGAADTPARCRECAKDAAESKRQQQAKVELERAAAERRRADAAVERQRQYEEHLRRIRLPKYLSSMPPSAFERLVLETYRRRGWHVTATPVTGDNGVDGFLRKDGKLCILQCKRVKGRVGEPVLRDLYGTMMHNAADRGVVVTTGRVSRQARAWLRGKPIEVLELGAIAEMIRETFPEHEVVPAGWQPLESR